jgi:hypothetical protein
MPFHRWTAGGADRGRPDDRGWEQQADDGPDGEAAPSAMARGRLVLVLVDLAVGVLGEDGGVVGADRAEGVQVFDDGVVAASCDLAGVGPR